MGRRGQEEGGEERGREGRGRAQVPCGAVQARSGWGRTAERGGGSGGGVTPATSAARGFAREREGTGPGYRAFLVGEQVLDAGSWGARGGGGVGVSGVVDGGPGHGRDAAASAVRAAAVRQPHHLGECEGAKGAEGPRRVPGAGWGGAWFSQASLRRSGGHLRPGHSANCPPRLQSPLTSRVPPAGRGAGVRR